MLKFTSPSPTNAELGKSMGKTEGAIRAYKKQKPEEIESLNLTYKIENYPFVKVEEFVNAKNQEKTKEEKEQIAKDLIEKIIKKELAGTAYTDGNNQTSYYIPPIIEEVEEIKNLFKENSVKFPITLSIGNHKGGANKTTNTTNIASSLAYFGFKVLIVDFDPQGNASGSFGIYENDYKNTIIDLIARSNENIENEVKESIINIDLSGKFKDTIMGKIDIIANNAAMSEKVEDLPTMSRYLGTVENTLERVLGYIKSDYDFILIDLPPRTDLILRIAMMSSDYFVISLNAQPFAKMGMPNILNPIRKFENIYKQERNKEFNILGGVVGCYEKGVTIQDVNYQQMKDDIVTCTNEASSLFATTIPKSTVVQTSQQGDGAVLFTNPTNKVVRNFFDLTLEILERIIINEIKVEDN